MNPLLLNELPVLSFRLASRNTVVAAELEEHVGKETIAADSKKAELESRIAELERENALLRQKEAEWLRTRERELQLERHLRNLGSDFPKNIGFLTKLCGDFLGGDGAFYVRLYEDRLIPYGQGNLSADFNTGNSLLSRLCRDLIQNGNEKFLHIPCLKDVPYTQEILLDAVSGDFQTFLGHAVEYGNTRVGVLGVLYQNPFKPTEHDKQIMTILATVIADEDRRNEALKVLRATEKALQESEERFRNLVNGIHDIVYSVNSDGCCTFIGPQVSRYGFSPDELLGKRFLDLIFAEDRELLADDFEKIRSGAQPHSNIVFRTMAKDGHIIWWENTAAALYDDNGRFQSQTGNLRDITARKLMEEKLRLTRKELSVRNHIAQIFLTLSDDDRIWNALLDCILEATESSYGLFGFIDDKGDLFCPSLSREVWEQCRMADKRLIFPRESWGGIWGRSLLEEKTFFSNQPLPVPAGHIPIFRVLTVPIVDQGGIIGNIMVGNKNADYTDSDTSLLEAIADCLAPVIREKQRKDIELKKNQQAEVERVEMARNMYHTQRLESLGILAGGIAHDFNNLLMAIMGNLEMMKLELSASSKAQSYLDACMNSSLRAADITRQMLAYSGKGRFLIRKVDICALIQEMLPLLESSLSQAATLQLDLCGQLPIVMADAGQIRQILINLVINASEALKEKTGFINIKTGLMSCDDTFLFQSRLNEKPPAGRFVFIEVADTGCGMDSETCDRLFDPFFTTKFIGRGLGMSAVLGIVRGHGGAVTVDSEPGKGTVIRILLPLQKADDNPGKANSSEGMPQIESDSLYTETLSPSKP
jgi:PAS domain S-box-containing protein